MRSRCDGLEEDECERRVELARSYAMEASTRVGRVFPDATAEEWLDCGDEFSEVTAAAAIVRVDPARVDDVLSVLIQGVWSNDYGIRCNAVWHLGQLGPVAKGSVPALQRLLDDESIRSLASEAIASIIGEES